MKITAVCITIIMSLLFVACGENIANINKNLGESSVYSKEDIGEAMDVVTNHFSKEFEGCEMTDLWYDEEFSTKQSAEWAEQYEAEEAIVLLSKFNVDESGGDGSFNPNDTYDNWMWILVRTKGDWELKTWGY